MKRNKDIPEIRDDEIRVIGGSQSGGNTRGKWWIPAAVTLAVAAGIVIAVLQLRRQDVPVVQEEAGQEEVVRGLYEQEEMEDGVLSARAYVEVEERTISGVPVRIFTPVGGEPSLMTGLPDFGDSSIVFIAQAADIRADNMRILGDFVLNGRQIAVGKSKWGWCSIIDGQVSIGYDKEPAELQESIEKGGYFFRQYGLIADGKYVKESSRWKYSSLRRALCLKDGECLIVETLEPETFPRFSYVLEDLQVDAAIYLVGGESYGFARDRDGRKTEFGTFDPDVIFDNTSYILWKF